MTFHHDHAGHVELNRHYWDDEAAAVHGPLAHGHWSATQPYWGLWATPESQVWMLPDAERVPFHDHRFGLAISEYGASLWCDPYCWIAEAARLLWPGGRLVFLRPSPLFALCVCVPAEGPVSSALLRPQFGLRRLHWGKSAEFNLPHGEMLRLLRSHGFMVEDLIEIQAPRDAHRDYPHVSADWAHNWPSEEIWKTRLAG